MRQRIQLTGTNRPCGLTTLHSYNCSSLGCTRESTYTIAIRFPVAMPEGPHPFPSRTRKLSPPGPMVLQGRLCGRVGSCQILWAAASIGAAALLFFGIGAEAALRAKRVRSTCDSGAAKLTQLGVPKLTHLFVQCCWSAVLI